MSLSRRGLKPFSITLLILSMTVTASAQIIAETNNDNASEQMAIEQLRGIAEMIRKCPDHDQLMPDGSGVHIDAPLNVVWDIERGQSVRSQKLGYVEFVRHSSYIPKPMEQCKKRDSNCQLRNEDTTQYNLIMEGVQSPDQFRYEFDFDSDRVRFARALMKRETADEAHWSATSLGHGCVDEAILSISNHPSERPVDSSPAAVSVSPNASPQAFPPETQEQSAQKITFHVTAVSSGEARDWCTTGKCSAKRFTVEGYSGVKGEPNVTLYALECVEVIANDPKPHITFPCVRLHANSDYEASLFADSVAFSRTSSTGSVLNYEIVSEKEVNKQKR